MSLPRSHKLGWIAFICAVAGFLIAEILGAITATHFLIIIAVPVLLGLSIGLLGIDESGECRNGRKVGLALGGVLLTVAALIGFAVYVIYSSTDL